jgi:hypothetical protein
MRAKKIAAGALIVLAVGLAGAAPSQARERDHGRFAGHHRFEGRHFHNHGFVGVTPFVWGPAYPYPHYYPGYSYAPAYVYVPPPPPPRAPSVWIRVR